MEEYIVSARKYRPMTFDSVVGQSALTTTLKNAVRSGKLAHAYLFCGPRGVGKTTCARIFAKVINCQNPTETGEACNECESCKAFNEQRSYNIFELDAASNNSVENIKALIEQTRIPPQVGKYKVFIIDEVHMLSTSAFNAFLKTLEEPPAHVIFILATTEKHKILPTIISRCQIYDFERMSVQGIVDHLKMVAAKEGITYEEQALSTIAEKADGGMRDALSIFDQAVSFCQGNITYKKVIEDLNVLDTDNYFNIVDLSLQNKVAEIMVLLNSIISKGFDGAHLINGLAAHIRNVLMAKDEETLPLLEVSQQQRDNFREQAVKVPTVFLYNALKILNQCDINYRQSSNKRLLVELTLIQIAQLTQPEDDAAGAGRCPTRLKSLFKNIVSSVQPKPAMQVAENAKPMQRITKATQHKEDTTAPSMQTQQLGDMPVRAANTPKIKFRLDSVGMTFGELRNRSAEKQEQQVEPEATDNDINVVFTDEELDLQWRMMCNRMPQELTAMASRMMNMRPKIKEFPNVEVVVDNKILFDQIMAISHRVRKTLATNLHNTAIEVNFRLAKPEEVGKVLSKREQFDELRKSNSSIEKLRTILGLELL